MTYVENMIDYRHSVVQANKRADAGDETLEICPHCMCEVDSDPQPHRPGCAGIGGPRVSTGPVLAALPEREPTEREESAGTDSPPAAGEDVTPLVSVTHASRGPVPAELASRSESAATKGRAGRPKLWTADKVVAELQRLAGEFGRTPTAAGLRSAATRLTPEACKREFGSMAAAVEAAGLPSVTRQPAESVPATEEASDETRELVATGEGTAEQTPDPPLTEPDVAADPLSFDDLTGNELVACGEIMTAVGMHVIGLPVAQRKRVARFVAALLEGACR